MIVSVCANTTHWNMCHSKDEGESLIDMILWVKNGCDVIQSTTAETHGAGVESARKLKNELGLDPTEKLQIGVSVDE